MLRVRFTRVQNVLVAEVLEQGPEIKRGTFEIKSADGVYAISSKKFPELSERTLYIRGIRDEQDHRATAYEYESAEWAERALDNFIELIKEHNKPSSKYDSVYDSEIVVVE